MVTGLIFDGLTTTDAHDMTVKPHLAQRWEVSVDGLTWTFYLRSGVRWNDGTPFTADDVVFTFNDLIYNDEIPSSARDIFTIDGKIFKVEKVNDLTVRFTLPVRFAPFLRGMGQAILPKHKLQKIVADGQFNFAWGIDTPPSEIVGTGPFMLTQYRPGRRLVFKRNPHYWKKDAGGMTLPYLEKVIFLIVQNSDATILKFLDGELDYTPVRGVDYPLLKPLEEQQDFTLFEAGPNFGSNFLVFNQNRGSHPETREPYVSAHKLVWFSDPVFRRAVAHAIDKEKMIEILKNGLGYPQFGPLSPSAGFFYKADVVKYPYDLKRAAALLAEAGFADRDGDGFLDDKNGNRIEFNFYTNSDNPERVQLAAIIRHDLQSLGMKVNLLGMEFNSLINKLNATFDWDAVLLGLTGGIEPHFGKNVWDSSGQLHMWYPRQEDPATSWEARVDEVFRLGVQELDENKRKVLYDEWQDIVARETPFIYTILGGNMFAVRNKFGNLQPTSYGGAFHNLEEIYIKENEGRRE